MEELKLVWQKEEDIPAEAQLPNIFSGNYRFATQSTAVYGDHTYIDLADRVIKLWGDYIRVYTDGRRIGVVRKGRLEIYEDNKLQKSFDVTTGVDGLHDIFSNDMMESILQTKEAKGLEIFRVGDGEVKIDPTKVEVRGKEFENTIAEEGAKYFVAHTGEVVIIGNNKSTDLLYFIGNEQTLPEECHSPALRVNSDYEIEYALDAKFYGNVLVMKDSSKETHYLLEGVPEAKSKPIVDCDLTADAIVERKKGQVRSSETTLPSTKNDQNTESDCITTKNRPESSSISKTPLLDDKVHTNDASKDQIVSPSSLATMVPKNQDLSLDKERSLCNSKPGTTSSFDFKKTDFSSCFDTPIVKESSLLGSKTAAASPSGSSLDLQSEVQVASKPGSSVASSIFDRVESTSASIFSNSTAKSPTLPKGNSIFNSKSTVVEKKPTESKAINGLNVEQSANVNALKADLQRRLTALNALYHPDGQAQKFPEIPSIKLSELTIDCGAVYNAVFHNSIKNFNETITNMINRLEVLARTDSCDILQGIRYIDSRIADRCGVRCPVHYSGALLPPTISRNSADSRIDALIESIKLINVKSIDQQFPSESANVQAKEQARPAAVDNPVPREMPVPKPVPPTPSPAKPTLQQKAVQSTPQVPLQTPTLTTNLFSGTNAQQTPQTLFGSPQINHPMHVADTTALFNNLSQAGSSVFNSTPNSAPQTQNNPPTSSGSALSRLADSRRMFK